MPEDDSFDVNDLFEDDSEPSPVEQAPQIDPNEITEMKQKLSTLEQQNKALSQWKDDASKVFSGQPESTATQEWAQTLMDPNAVAGMIDQQVNQRMAEQNLRQEYRTKHQDLAQFEDYILNDARALASRETGPYKGDRHYVDEAITQFKAKLPSGSTQRTQGQALQAMALDMGTGSTTNQPKKLDIWGMSNEEFEKFDQKVQKSLRE